MRIGIVGARKYRDRQSVVDLVNSLPRNWIIVTSSCTGVCTWAKEAGEKRGMKVLVYTPDLTNIRSSFEVPKRYYKRNRELVETCDFLYAFISEEDGLIGGTRFEVEYATKLGIPVQIHHENGRKETFYQYFLPFMDEKQGFFLAWEDFFNNTNLNLGGLL